CVRLRIRARGFLDKEIEALGRFIFLSGRFADFQPGRQKQVALWASSSCAWAYGVRKELFQALRSWLKSWSASVSRQVKVNGIEHHLGYHGARRCFAMLKSVTPCFIVDDLEATIAFYQSKLGFEVRYKGGGEGADPDFWVFMGRDQI